MMEKLLIIQARMGSSRLPGKVLMPVCATPLLGILLQRLQACQRVNATWVATTDLPQDDPIADYAHAHGVKVFRGSETDVLGRYWGCVQAAQVRVEETVIIRITADCPLMDPNEVDRVLERFERGDCDYLSNTTHVPRGLDVEVFSAKALQAAFEQADQPYEREHVTPYLYQHPNRFRVRFTEAPQNLRHERWTVDTPEDLALIQKILEALWPVNPLFSQADVLDLLDAHLDWRSINAHIQQKAILENVLLHKMDNHHAGNFFHFDL